MTERQEIRQWLARNNVIYMAHDEERVTVFRSAPLRVEWRFDRTTGRLVKVRRFDGVPKGTTRPRRGE